MDDKNTTDTPGIDAVIDHQAELQREVDGLAVQVLYLTVATVMTGLLCAYMVWTIRGMYE